MGLAQREHDLSQYMMSMLPATKPALQDGSQDGPVPIQEDSTKNMHINL